MDTLKLKGESKYQKPKCLGKRLCTQALCKYPSGWTLYFMFWCGQSDAPTMALRVGHHFGGGSIKIARYMDVLLDTLIIQDKLVSWST